MKITLLNFCSPRKEYINKDVMGGYGLVTKVGNSLLAKLITRQKKKAVNIPVFALGYIAAILSQNGHEVEFQNDMPSKNSDLVIIPSSIVDCRHEVELAKTIKKQNPRIKIGFFGPFASLKPEIYLEAADFVIRNEPEEIIYKIKERWIPQGIVESSPVENLDKLPFPKWELFPIKTFSYKPLIKKSPFVPVLSSRGCVFNCDYCPYKAYYGFLRKRSPDSVIKELEYLKNKFNIKAVQFRDPIFTADRNRVLDIAKKIIERKMNIEWGCETHLSCLDKDLIDVLYKSGLRAIGVGIESPDINILKNVNRSSASIKTQEELIKHCHKKGINISAFYILGLPKDTKQGVKNTIKYAQKLNTLVAQFMICTPFPGTKLYQSLKNKIFEKDWEKFNSYTPVWKHDNLTKEELLQLKEEAFVKYYFRPAYLYRFIRSL